jgi:hypothetical protein
MLALVVVSLWPRAAAAIERHPDVLPGEAGCERWLGGSSGNDPSVRLNLVLCEKGGRASGHVQWSSLVSGWSVREVTGIAGRDGALLRDVTIVEQRPEPGWRFCTVDRWALRREGERLVGTYDSEACADHATVWFERMPEGDAGVAPAPAPNPGPTPSPSPTPSPPPPSPTPDPAPDRRRSCRCAGSTDTAGAALSILLALALVSRRRRPR